MKANTLPDMIPNWINGLACNALSRKTFDKLSPDTGRKLCHVARSGSQDVQNAIQAARLAQADWAERTPVERGDILHDIAQAMRKHQKEIAEIVAMETGMSFSAAMGETGGAIAQAELNDLQRQSEYYTLSFKLLHQPNANNLSDSIPIATTSKFPQEYTDTGLTLDTTYIYNVSSFDQAQTESSLSDSANAFFISSLIL